MPQNACHFSLSLYIARALFRRCEASGKEKRDQELRRPSLNPNSDPSPILLWRSACFSSGNPLCSFDFGFRLFLGWILMYWWIFENQEAWSCFCFVGSREFLLRRWGWGATAIVRRRRGGIGEEAGALALEGDMADAGVISRAVFWFETSVMTAGLCPHWYLRIRSFFLFCWWPCYSIYWWIRY